MVDQTKRDTLKHFARIGAGVAGVTASANAISSIGQIPPSTATLTDGVPFDDLADIEVGVKLSAQQNDLEVVIKNTGPAGVRITDMTPAQIKTARGKFDFQALFENGDLLLASGESVHVPLQHHTVALDGSTMQVQSSSLSKALKQNVSVITNGDSLAVVSVSNYIDGIA